VQDGVARVEETPRPANVTKPATDSAAEAASDREAVSSPAPSVSEETVPTSEGPLLAPGDGSSPESTVAGIPEGQAVAATPDSEQVSDDSAATANGQEPAARDPEPAVETEPSKARKARRGELLPLSEVEQPPFPVIQPAPQYDQFARKLKQQGTVVLQLLIDEEGRVSEIEFVTMIPNSRLNDSAAAAAKNWIYRPAYRDGVPVKVWITEKVVFKL